MRKLLTAPLPKFSSLYEHTLPDLSNSDHLNVFIHGRWSTCSKISENVKITSIWSFLLTQEQTRNFLPKKKNLSVTMKHISIQNMIWSHVMSMYHQHMAGKLPNKLTTSELTLCDHSSGYLFIKSYHRCCLQWDITISSS